MNLSLNPDLERIVKERVSSGKYATPEDVVAAAILALDQQERFGDFETGEMDRLLAEGEESIERDGTLDGEDAIGCGVSGAARDFEANEDCIALQEAVDDLENGDKGMPFEDFDRDFRAGRNLRLHHD